MILALVLAAVAALLAVQLSFPRSFGRPPRVETADWIQKPTPEQLLAAYPSIAKAFGVAGTALIRCSVTAEGRADRCEALREEPAGLGFGKAAAGLAPYFRREPKSLPASGQVVIPVDFRMTVRALPALPLSSPPLSTPAERLGQRVAKGVRVSHYFEAVMRRMLRETYRRFPAEPSSAQPVTAKMAYDALNAVSEQHYAELEKAAARGYAARMPQAQLAEVAAFYETPAGETWSEVHARDSNIGRFLDYVRAGATRRACKDCDMTGAPEVPPATPPLSSRAELLGQKIARTMKVRDFGEAIFQSRRAALLEAMAASSRDAKGFNRAAALAALDATFADLIQELEKVAARSYVKAMSEAELSAVVGFYESGAGKAWYRVEFAQDGANQFLDLVRREAALSLCKQTNCAGPPTSPAAH